MKTKITYLLLIISTIIVGFQSCKDDKVDGAVFSLSIDGQESTSITFGYGQTFVMAKLRSATDRHSSWRSFPPIRDGACQATNPGVPCQMYQATRLTNNTLKSR